MHAVVLAGGRGTRLRPLTDTRPKPLIPFGGDPFAAGLLRRLSAAGCTNATFLVGQDAQPFLPLRDLGTALGVPVDVVTEPEPLDTAGAARDLLRGRAEGPAIVCNGDILTDLDFAALLDQHRRAGAVATLALTRVEDTSSFGVIELDDEMRVRRFVEKPPAGTVAADTINAGTYVLSEGAFDGCPTTGPLSFERSVFPGLVEAGAVVLGVPSTAFWMDLGTPQRYLAGHRAVLTGACAWPVGAAFARVAETVLVHQDAIVDDRASLDDCVTVGAGAQVAAGVRLANCAIFEGAQIAAGATNDGAIVGEHAVISAGADLSAGAVVAPHATV